MLADAGLLLCLGAFGIVAGALLCWFDGTLRQDEQRYTSELTGRGDE